MKRNVLLQGTVAMYWVEQVQNGYMAVRPVTRMIKKLAKLGQLTGPQCIAALKLLAEDGEPADMWWLATRSGTGEQYRKEAGIQL